jgi:putative transposase
MKWYCRYHVVIVPKYRRKSMFGAIRREVGEIFKELCRRFGIELVEGHVMVDHVHMCLGIPPKYRPKAPLQGGFLKLPALPVVHDFQLPQCDPI